MANRIYGPKFEYKKPTSKRGLLRSAFSPEAHLFAEAKLDRFQARIFMHGTTISPAGLVRGKSVFTGAAASKAESV